MKSFDRVVSGCRSTLNLIIQLKHPNDLTNTSFIRCHYHHKQRYKFLLLHMWPFTISNIIFLFKSIHIASTRLIYVRWGRTLIH